MELIRRADCGVMQSITESAEGTLLLLERQNSATCSMVGGSCGNELSTCRFRDDKSCASKSCGDESCPRGLANHEPCGMDASRCALCRAVSRA